MVTRGAMAGDFLSPRCETRDEVDQTQPCSSYRDLWVHKEARAIREDRQRMAAARKIAEELKIPI